MKINMLPNFQFLGQLSIIKMSISDNRYSVKLYGLAGFSLQILWQMMPLFLLFYYTDILGLKPVLAGAIFTIALVWDALTDPLIGFWATKSGARKGHFTNWMKWGAFPMAISFMAMFSLGLIAAPDMILAALCLITHILYRSFLTCVKIPYGMMATSLTLDSQSRNGLAASRVLWGFIGAVIVAAATLPLVAFLGRGNEASGFFYVSIIYAGLSLFGLMAFVK